MPRRILIVQGHPDPAGGHYGHALAEAYASAATGAGHSVETIVPAMMNLPYVTTQQEWLAPSPLPDVRAAQEALRRAEHLVLIYPLWLGDMPALTKSFLEHISCNGAMISEQNGRWQKKLIGKSARVIVTMGMPALAYRLLFLAHSLRSLERNILKFAGLSPVRSTVIGSVSTSADHRTAWLARVRALGQAGQ
jgi:putative NADPH-quinone reductase